MWPVRPRSSPRSWKTVAAWSLVLALALTFGTSSTVDTVALPRCRSRKWKNTRAGYHFAAPKSSLAMLQEVPTSLQRQERWTTPRHVSAGGGPDQDFCSGKNKITAIAEQASCGA